MKHNPFKSGFKDTGANCFVCGKSKKREIHEHCREKYIDAPDKKALTKNQYATAKRNYKNGNLPKWMYS